MSARQDAINELRARVAGITVDLGYQTDIGLRVFVAEDPVFGPDDPAAAAALVIDDDEPGFQGEKIVIVLPVHVAALVEVADLDDPWSTVEAGISDIKRAVEVDHDLGGTLLRRGLERGRTRPLKRAEGSTFVGAAVEYRLQYAEGWGAP